METSELLNDAIQMRASEPSDRTFWFCVEDAALPAAHALHEAGVLDRRQHDADPVWRLADDAFAKVEAAAAQTAAMN